MTDRYVIASMLLASDAEIEITESEFEDLVSAINALLNCVDAEEKFDALVENYRELERFMMDRSLHSMLFGEDDDIAFQTPRSTTSRKLANFLSSVRLYQDTIGRHAKAITRDDNTDKTIKATTSHQYDASLDYRILEALRNHSQHHALPVHNYSVKRWWDKDRTFSNHEFEPNICVSDLAQNPDFKKATLMEMQKGPDMLKLKPMLRNYLEGLSAVHQSFRNATQRAIIHETSVIENCRERFSRVHPSESDEFISAYVANEDGVRTSLEYQFAKTLFQYIEHMQRKNRHLINFARRRISY